MRAVSVDHDEDDPFDVAERSRAHPRRNPPKSKRSSRGRYERTAVLDEVDQDATTLQEQQFTSRRLLLIVAACSLAIFASALLLFAFAFDPDPHQVPLEESGMLQPAQHSEMALRTDLAPSVLSNVLPPHASPSPSRTRLPPPLPRQLLYPAPASQPTPPMPSSPPPTSTHRAGRTLRCCRRCQRFRPPCRCSRAAASRPKACSRS